jgi:hypothetical protein
VLIATGRLNSLTMRFHTNMQKMANLCVSDVFWKWSKGDLMKRERGWDGANGNGLQQYSQMFRLCIIVNFSNI